MVPMSSIVCMSVTLVFVTIMAIVLPIVIKVKWKTAVSPYFIGVGVFAVFALILESIMHNIVLGATGDTITGNMWLYALYGGLAAGVFEETGRFLAMKFLMKKHYANDHNALMYGVGHGCGEAVLLVGLTMVSNIIFSVMKNAGQTDFILSSVPAEQQDALRQSISVLTDTASYTFLLSGFERVTAVILHIAFSLLVWTAAAKKKILFFPLALFFHALVDGVFVVLQQSGVSLPVTEIGMFVVSVALVIFAYFIWKKDPPVQITEDEPIPEVQETV